MGRYAIECASGHVFFWPIRTLIGGHVAKYAAQKNDHLTMPCEAKPDL